MARAEPQAAAPSRAGEPRNRRPGPVVAVAAAVFTIALAAYLTDVLTHLMPEMLTWFDLKVYSHAGLLARRDPGRLYAWQLRPGIRFTYTPFAALLFAAGSLLPFAVLKWLMTVASLAAVMAAIWLTLRALGWRDRYLAAGVLGIGAIALWTEPVQRSLHLGQVEPVLMLVIIWDLSQDSRRWWKGAGVGLAAGIKLVPLIFIPYLIAAGKLRQAAAACAAFAVTVAAGFAFLPRVSVSWWLTGYFLRARNVGKVGSLLNQSLLGMLTRADGRVKAATPAWLALSVVTAVAGVTAAALLHRRDRPVAGWLTCALTGLIVSPVSWDHHWIWIVPLIALLADASLRSRAAGPARWLLAGLAGAVAMLFGAWPHISGPLAGIPHGLIGSFLAARPAHHLYRLHGAQILSGNLFILAGLGLLAGALAAAAGAVRTPPVTSPAPAASPGPAPAAVSSRPRADDRRARRRT